MSRLDAIKEILENEESEVEELESEVSELREQLERLSSKFNDQERMLYQVRELLEATINQINSEYRKNKEAEFIIQQQKQLIDQLHLTIFNSNKGSYQ